MQAVWWIRLPSKRVGEQGGAVEEVSEKGSDEQSWREASGGAASCIFVNLGEAGAEVEDG